MSEKIMVVDDEPIIRFLICEVLSEKGYYTINAKNGIDAINKFIRFVKDIQLVLLDMELPDLKGNKLLEILKKIKPSIKVIMISGYSSKFIKDECVGLDLDGIIEKPFNSDNLLSYVNQFI